MLCFMFHVSCFMFHVSCFVFLVSLKRGKRGMRGIHVLHHAQVVDKGGIARAGFIVAKQLRLAAVGGKRVEFGKSCVPDGGASHGQHADVQQRVG